MPVTIDGTTGISGNGSGLTDLNASNLSTGTVPDARFPATLPAVSGANLTALNASNLGSGTVPDARFPATLPAASGANLTALNASNLGSGTVPDARFPATLPAASGANLTNLNASNLSSGTVGTARLGTGTANSTTFLRGDGTWAAAGGAPANLGDVGTVVTAALGNTSQAKPGDTIAGSNVYIATTITGGPNRGYPLYTEGTSDLNRPATFYSGFIQGLVEWGSVTRVNSGNTGIQPPGGHTAQSGTWRILGFARPRSSSYDNYGGANTTSSSYYVTMAQRIA